MLNATGRATVKQKPRVVIIGGGFGGLTATQELRRAEVAITLIDRTNHHVFQPLLYQVATAALSPADIAAPLRATLRSQRNVRIVMEDVMTIDRQRRAVILSDETNLPFDYLIVAPGSRHFYFGKDDWETFAPGLKTLADALEIRDRLLLSFECAVQLPDTPAARKHLTYVVVGGGATGVEVAGALAEIARQAIVRDFPGIQPDDFRIILLEGEDRVLSAYPEELSDKAMQFLKELGVTVHLKTRVTDVTRDGVYAGKTLLETANVIWAAGNQASPLLRTLNVPLDAQRRVIVRPDLTIPEESRVFVIGDAACAYDARRHPLPGLAPVAMQQARYVARVIAQSIPQERRKPFVYRDWGSMTTIGRAKAIAQIGTLRFAGVTAWLLWSFVHIFFLIGFRNRLRVMSEWIWYYFTSKPGAQLIYWKVRKAPSSQPEKHTAA